MRPGRGRSQATWVDDRPHPAARPAARTAACTSPCSGASPWRSPTSTSSADAGVLRGARLGAGGHRASSRVGLVARCRRWRWSRSRRWRAWWTTGCGRGLHLAFVAVLAAAVALQVLERLAPSGSGRRADRRSASWPGRVRAGLRPPAGRPVGGHRARARAAAVLRPVPLLLAGDAAPGRRRRRAAWRRVDSRVPVVMVVFDELPVTSLLGPDGRVDARALPQLRRAWRARSTWYRNTATVDSGHGAGRARAAGRQVAAAARLPTLADHPRNLFTLLGVEPSPPRRRAGHPPVPARAVRRAPRGGVVSRLRSLVSDSRIVSLHLLLPRDLREGLPSISDRWQGFGEVDPVGDGRRRRRAARRRAAAIGLRRALRGLGARPPVRRAALPRRHPAAGPGGTAAPALPARDVPALAVAVPALRPPVLRRHRAPRAGPRTAGRRPLRAAACTSSAICCRSATPTACSGSCSTGCAPRGSSTARWSSWSPTTASASAPDSARAARRGRPRPTSSRCRCSSRRPASGPGGSSTRRSARSTSCRRSPTALRRAACRGGSTGGRPPAPAATARSSCGAPAAGRLASTPAWVRARRRAALRRQVAIFGHGGGRPGIYGLGPHPELHRAARSPAWRCARSATRADIDQAPVLAQVDKRDRVGARATSRATSAGRPAGRASTSPWR